MPQRQPLRTLHLRMRRNRRKPLQRRKAQHLSSSDGKNGNQEWKSNTRWSHRRRVKSRGFDESVPQPQPKQFTSCQNTFTFLTFFVVQLSIRFGNKQFHSHNEMLITFWLFWEFKNFGLQIKSCRYFERKYHKMKKYWAESHKGKCTVYTSCSFLL